MFPSLLVDGRREEREDERRDEGTARGGAAAQARDLKREERKKDGNSRRIDLKGCRLHFLRLVDKSIEGKKKAIVEQIRGIREKGKKRGRQGAEKGRRMFGFDVCLFFCLFCENGTGKNVRK